MAGRFPQAENLEAFWELLKHGREAVQEFSDKALRAAGVDEALLQHPDYVKSGAVVPGIADFDADFFEMSGRDAEITDPQQRLFLECAWQALEQAGYPSATTDASVGVYAGVGDNSYLTHCLEPNFETLLPTTGAYRLFTLSGKDFIATRTAYKLNLTGPAMSIQTACSTSLVAVHAACQSLLNMECEMALAGGASISIPQERGYLYQEGMIMSPDGHCRAFDAQAQGTAGGAGVGMILLKRLDDALADGDTIHAVIRGSAVNNDGADKIGYTAPSVNGQSAVISEAQSVADIHPDEISYIEAHGTGTPLGDPVEIQALTEAFRADTRRMAYCAIGSVKTNIGHADAAAGIAGLIKTVLALKHRLLPPSLHYQHPNPQIDFADSPFFVNNKLTHWEADEFGNRCAGVSSFGVGGTNAHVIVEQAPVPEPSGLSRPLQLITLSAKTAATLEKTAQNLMGWLQSHRESDPADIAYTLNQGRQDFPHRRAFVCSDIDEGLRQLTNFDVSETGKVQEKKTSVVFLFPGQGSQYLNMSKNLYAHEAVFKNALDECAGLLTPYLQRDLRDLLYTDKAADKDILKQTLYTQPALFSVEYALAKLWMSWGVKPTAMLGHSIGEYVAACLAGVFSLEDALSLVATRAKLVQSLPEGVMLAVPLSEAELQGRMSAEVSLAAVNGAENCVVSGTQQAITTLREALRIQGIESRTLHTSHAFHSHLLEPVAASFSRKLRQITLHPPGIPYLSNFSGDWIRPEQAVAPDYWVSHLRHTVRFAENVHAVLKHQSDILLEVGPGQTLSALIRQHPEYAGQCTLLSSLPPQRKTGNQAELEHILKTLGQLWCNGVSIDWRAFYAEEKRRRLPLPTYPFERQRYWIDPPKQHPQKRVMQNNKTPARSEENSIDSRQWLYRPSWIQKALSNTDAAAETTPQHWILFEDHCGVAQQLQQALQQQGHTVISVQGAMAFERKTAGAYCINPEQAEDYESLIHALAEDEFPNKWLHCWMINREPSDDPFKQSEQALQLGFYSLLYLTQALGRCNINQSLDITALSNQMQAVIDSDQVRPEKATLLGAVKTIGREADKLHCRSIDISLPFNSKQQIQSLLSELSTAIHEPVIAYRQGQRWIQNYQAVQWQSPLPTQRLRRQGTYLITGGLGGIGLTLAEYLAYHVQAKLILIGRSVFPAKTDWPDYLSTHDQTDAISQKIHFLEGLEKEGAEVLIYNADVADIRQMREVIESGQQQFGKIHGVIHSASIPDGALIANRDQQTSAQVFAPKVTGTLVLNQLLADNPLDFFSLCSSLASIVGIPGQISYCAANAFQDAFAQARRHHPKTLFIAINWDTWQKVGMAVKAVNDPTAAAPGRNLSEHPLDTTHPLFHAYRKDGPRTSENFRLSVGTKGDLESLKLQAVERTPPSDHEIEIEVFAVGLNFKEILYALDMLPMPDDFLFGLECAGRVSRVGRQVTSFTTNDRVVAFAAGSLGRFTCVDIGSAALQPPSLEAAEAATIPVAYVTAYYALMTVGRLQKGERVLIHAAAGGVGMAAVRIAQWAGAEIFATAGSSKKREYLHSLGIQYVMDSRSNNFAEQIMDYTRNEGVDVVLNSLSGELMLKNFEILSPFGRFLELGVRDIYNNTLLGLKSFAQGQTYAAIQFGPSTPRVREIFQKVMHLIEIKKLSLLPSRVYPLSKISEAFEHMARARHIGKVVIAIQEHPETQADIKAEKMLSHGLLPEEGVRVFEQVLQHQQAQILVAKQGLSALFEQVGNLFNTEPTDAGDSASEEKSRPLSAPSYVAPRTEIEKKLVAIWQKFLGISPVGIEDDFFEFGGDSLLAVQLASYIRTQLQVALSTQALLNAPTIASLAGLLKDTDAQPVAVLSKPDLLVKIKTGNPQKTPLVMIHPIGGHVFFYRELAQQLNEDQPFYGIQAQGVDGKSTPINQVEEMAGEYIRQLQIHQPAGSYLLGGSSFGGMIAYEMARQLKQHNENVALLTLIDTPGPGHMPVGHFTDDVDVMAYVLEVGSNIIVSPDELRKMDEQTRWEWFVEKTGGDDTQSSQMQSRVFMNLFRASMQAMFAYQPQPWDGDVIFFRAMEQDAYNAKTPEKAWASLVRGTLAIWPVPGNHITMNTQPNVKILADYLQQEIDRAIHETP